MVNDNMHEKTVCRDNFALEIPLVETWTCRTCRVAWSVKDGTLSAFGRDWTLVQDAQIPEGTMAAFGEEPEQ